MRKLLLLACACTAVSCGEPTSPSAAIVISAVTSVQSIQAGQNVTIMLTIFNPGDTDVRLALGGCQRPFDVLNRFGAVVGPRPAEVCSLALLAPTVVPANSSVTFETHWAGDASQIGPADEVIYLPPGSYYVRPRVQLVDDGSVVLGKVLSIGIKPE